MAKVSEVEVKYTVGGQVQVKKFDIQSTYEYSASKRASLEDGDSPDDVISDLGDSLKALLDPPAQQDFEDLWDQRLRSEGKKD